MSLCVISSAWLASRQVGWVAKAKSPKLPTDIVDEEDESCSEESLCLTPFSQASTAPSTPLRIFLPDPLGCDICMSMLCEQFKQAEKTDSFDAPPQPTASVFLSTPPLSIPMSQWWAEYRQYGTETILDSCESSRKSACAMPRSQQQFAILECVKVYKKERLPRSQQHYAVLKSVGNYHEYQARKEPRSQQLFAVLEFVKIYVKEHLPRSQQLFAVLESVGNYHEYQARKEPRSQQQFAVLEFADTHDYQVVKDAALIKHFGLDIVGLMKHFGLNINEATLGAELEHVDGDDDEWMKVNQLEVLDDDEWMNFGC